MNDRCFNISTGPITLNVPNVSFTPVLINIITDKIDYELVLINFINNNIKPNITLLELPKCNK